MKKDERGSGDSNGLPQHMVEGGDDYSIEASYPIEKNSGETVYACEPPLRESQSFPMDVPTMAPGIGSPFASQQLGPRPITMISDSDWMRWHGKLMEWTGDELSSIQALLDLSMDLERLGANTESARALVICNRLILGERKMSKFYETVLLNPDIGGVGFGIGQMVFPQGFPPRGVMAQTHEVTYMSPATPYRFTSGRSLRKVGNAWLFEYDGKAIPVHDWTGMRNLGILILNPFRRFRASELRSMGVTYFGSSATTLQIVGTERELVQNAESIERRRDLRQTDDAAVDKQAINEISAKIETLRVRRDSAVEREDFEAATKADDELSQLEDYIKKSRGLRGRRRLLSNDDDRARKAVSKSLRNVIEMVALGSTELANHLSRSLQTGFEVSYSPQDDAITII